MKYFIFILLAFLCLSAFSQSPVTFTGTISEKVELSVSDSNLKFIENYDPLKSYKMLLIPAIIKFTFNGKERTYHGIKPAYRDENKSLVFLVRESEKAPTWMLLITPDGDKLWAEIDESKQVMRGYYLR